MASIEFIEKFKEFKNSLIEVSDLFDELYVSSELELVDLNENFVMILAHLSDEKPKNNSDIPYLVTCLFDGFSRKEFIVDMFYYEEDSFKWNPQNDVIAWAELPEPYKEQT